MRNLRIRAWRRAASAAAIAGTVLSLALPEVEATELRGRVVIRGELGAASEPATRRYYWSLDNGVLPPRQDRIFPDRDLAIVLAQRGRGQPRRDAAPVLVKIQAGGMLPAAIVVPPGALVRFQNADPFTHELYSPTHPDFSAEPMAPGQTRPLTVPSGQVEIRCRRTPSLRGFVVATEAAYVVRPGADGVFNLSAVDAGTYTVRIFFEGRWLAESEIVVNAERSQTVELVVDASNARPRAEAAPAAGAGRPSAPPSAMPQSPSTPARPPAPAAGAPAQR